jgi:hypothetical protein
MAETNLTLIQDYEESDTARTYRILTADSASAIPPGEYIYFKAILKNGIERTIKDASGEAVKLTAIDDMVVLDYNFITIKPIYYGDNKPSDLKVYQF